MKIRKIYVILIVVMLFCSCGKDETNNMTKYSKQGNGEVSSSYLEEEIGKFPFLLDLSINEAIKRLTNLGYEITVVESGVAIDNNLIDKVMNIGSKRQLEGWQDVGDSFVYHVPDDVKFCFGGNVDKEVRSFCLVLRNDKISAVWGMGPYDLDKEFLIKEDQLENYIFIRGLGKQKYKEPQLLNCNDRNGDGTQWDKRKVYEFEKSNLQVSLMYADGNSYVSEFMYVKDDMWLIEGHLDELPIIQKQNKEEYRIDGMPRTEQNNSDNEMRNNQNAQIAEKKEKLEEKFCGYWQDSWSQRADMEISYNEKAEEFTVVVNWTGGASINRRWGLEKGFICDNGKAIQIMKRKEYSQKYLENGQFTETLINDEGLSYLYFKDNCIYWYDDYNAESGFETDKCVFVRVPQ